MKQIYNDVDLDDVTAVLAHIDGFLSDLGMKLTPVNANEVNSVVLGMKSDFPHADGLESASSFKKAANFLCYFITIKPIKSRLPKSAGDLADYDPNVVVGLDIALSSLHGAELHGADNKTRKIENELALSSHSYFDLLNSLKNVTPRDHFHLVAVLLEQITYKTNPECQYQDMAYGQPPAE